MWKRWQALPLGIRWLVGIAAVVLAMAVVWALFVPVADWLAHHDVGSVTGSLHETALDNARGRLLTLGAGLFAAGALWFTGRSFTLSREGQVTDRYTKAIEQLGSDKLDVRIGGIYALERVARDSPQDHPTVVEVLAAFIREHSREQWPLPEGNTDPAPPRETRSDVQVALTVIGRRDMKRDLRSIDLTRANLHGADLRGAHLARAELRGVDLTGAHLDGAFLAMADLSGAHLARAELRGVDLTRADLFRADLTGADLDGADLSGAKLAAARLDDASLHDADLSGADLGAARLNSADLTGAKWPEGAWFPTGWKLDTSSGRLAEAGADSGPTGAN